MSGQANNFEYVLVDSHNNGILCFPKTYSAGAALSKGLLSTLLLPIRMQFQFVQDKWKDINRKEFLQLQQSTDDTILRPLEGSLRTPEFLERYKLANLRHDYHYRLEVNCLSEMSRTSRDYFASTLDSYLVYELLKCKPHENFYTSSIKQYAQIQQIPVEVAFNELEVRIDNNSATLIRNYAIYLKYVDKINNNSTSEDLEETMKQFWFDLASGSRL